MSITYWLILLSAGFFEVVWAVALKFSHGFTNMKASAVCIIAMVMSIWLLSISLKHIPLGTAYAVWTGIGAVGGVIVGIFMFHEMASISRLLYVALIIIGIIGLKLSS